jgi:hypothetical protein
MLEGPGAHVGSAVADTSALITGAYARTNCLDLIIPCEAGNNPTGKVDGLRGVPDRRGFSPKPIIHHVPVSTVDRAPSHRDSTWAWDGDDVGGCVARSCRDIAGDGEGRSWPAVSLRESVCEGFCDLELPKAIWM